MQQFRGGLVFKAHRLCASLNSRCESNTEEEEVEGGCLGAEFGNDCNEEVHILLLLRKHLHAVLEP